MEDCDLRYKIGLRNDNKNTTLTLRSNHVTNQRQFKQIWRAVMSIIEESQPEQTIIRRLRID